MKTENERGGEVRNASALLRDRAKGLTALAVLAALYPLARPEGAGPDERAELASRYRFERSLLPEVVPPRQSIRRVHPNLAHVAAWISAVGASIALADLDGDGFEDDAAWVDPRSDTVLVAPVPGSAAETGVDYAAFALWSPAPHEPSAPMGVLPGDLDEDGLLDLLVYCWGRPPIAFLHSGASLGRGGERDALDAAAFHACELADPGERWYTNAALLADVDGDGHADLVLGNYFPDGSRVLDPRAGGLEELQSSMSRAFNGGRDRLLLSTGATHGARRSVSYRDASDAFDREVAGGWTLALAAADLDGDLLPELYVANDFGPDRLLHNRSTPGHPAFASVEGVRGLASPKSTALGRDSFKGMGAEFADLDGDARLDLLVSNIAEEYGLLESHFAFLATGESDGFRAGVAPFVDRSEPLGLARGGWAWDVRAGDFDLDGHPEVLRALGFLRGRANRWPELQELATANDGVLANPRAWPRFGPGDDLSGQESLAFLSQDRRGRFADIAAELGLEHAAVSRGIATADVDRDGDLDLAIASQWGPSRFHRNVGPRRGAFLGLRLLLPLEPAPNAARSTRASLGAPGARGRPALGAEARVRCPDGRMLVAQVDGGNGHSGKRSSSLHFGIGAGGLGAGELPAQVALEVELRWRDGDGRPCSDRLELEPGWHTVMLGGSREESTRP